MRKENHLDTLHHAALRVKNVKETVEWYTKRFRCNVEYQDATWAMLEFANLKLALRRSAQFITELQAFLNGGGGPLHCRGIAAAGRNDGNFPIGQQSGMRIFLRRSRVLVM